MPSGKIIITAGPDILDEERLSKVIPYVARDARYYTQGLQINALDLQIEIDEARKNNNIDVVITGFERTMAEGLSRLVDRVACEVADATLDRIVDRSIRYAAVNATLIREVGDDLKSSTQRGSP